MIPSKESIEDNTPLRSQNNSAIRSAIALGKGNSKLGKDLTLRNITSETSLIEHKERMDRSETTA